MFSNAGQNTLSRTTEETVIRLKKAIFTSFRILGLLSVLFLMECEISVKADPTTWTVDDDGPADFSTIQEAINNAISGDTILVRAGIYYEHVIVNKSLSLIGEDRDLTIVDGSEIDNVISIIMANNVSIEGFTIKGSGTLPYSGIFIDHSSGIDISHNTISSNNNDGISLYVSGGNVFSGNTISSNNYYGMYFLLGSKNNIIYCNNFNNVDQVQTDSVNIWDNGEEGNYWSEYSGQDLNADGIGDTAYIIDVNNQDNHPLMGMFSDFEITFKRETYRAATICNSTISDFRLEIGPETGNKIIRFNVTGKNSTVGFCRIMIPTELMDYPYTVLVDMEEIVPTRLEHISNEKYIHLYFTYIHGSHTITIIFSRERKLEIGLYNLNATYYALLDSYGILLGNYSQLQESYRELNDSYHEHLLDYSKSVHNIRSLMYIFATTTAIFLITIIYLSKRARIIAG